jgi:NAD(P) transhydrogenase
MVVMGAGSIGCEYASIFTALGVEVAVLDRHETLLRFLDTEISNAFKSIQSQLGVDFVLGVDKASIRREDGRLVVKVPEGREIRTEKVLFAAGRVGNTANLRLEQAGVDVDERDHVIVDARLQTTAQLATPRGSERARAGSRPSRYAAHACRGALSVRG